MSSAEPLKAPASIALPLRARYTPDGMVGVDTRRVPELDAPGAYAAAGLASAQGALRVSIVVVFNPEQSRLADGAGQAHNDGLAPGMA